MPITVNVHFAKTHLSRLIDQAHADEQIILAKAGKAWARLVPLVEQAPRRQSGLTLVTRDGAFAAFGITLW